MGFTSIWHWIIVLAVVLILFARPGKISGIMGDFGKGLRSFKEGVKSPEDPEEEELENSPYSAGVPPDITCSVLDELYGSPRCPRTLTPST